MNGQPSNAAGKRLRVLAVTAEPLLAFGLERLLDGVPDLAVATARTLGAAALAWQGRADLLLIDPASSTPDELRLARRDLPLTPIALWARGFSEDLVVHARECGVVGFLPRTAPNHELVEMLRALASGNRVPLPVPATEEVRQSAIHLSRRQSQIVGLLAQGRTNREVAASLGLTEGTVKSYLIQLFRKTGARDRFELAIMGLKNAWPAGEGVCAVTGAHGGPAAVMACAARV